MTCNACARPMVRQNHDRPEGHVTHKGRGLCSGCYSAAKNGSARACTMLTGACICKSCQLAEQDSESPMDISTVPSVRGRHGIRRWVS